MYTNNTDIPLGLAVWLLHDPKTGLIYWKKTKGRGKAGTIAGSTAKNGYVTIRLDGVLYYAHRLMWAFEYGYWPENIDHINGDRGDNRIANLREVTKGENTKNSGMRRNNQSGYKGVSWSKVLKKWIAVISVDSQYTNLGSFHCPIEAAHAYDAAAIKYHGIYAKTNKQMGLL